ncbi:MAG: hypothetical protein ACRD93_08850, partial [Nitrososphaeraceae archaeon]
KEKVAQVQQNPGQGASSGVPIIGKNLGDVALFGGAIVAIFGAVAAAFIVLSRGKRAVKA